MGAIVYWRELTNGPDAPVPKYRLRCEVIQPLLHMWDGSTTDKKTGQKKKQKTLEPEDYVRTYLCRRCTTSHPCCVQHGNVDHILFELYCYEVVEYLNKKFPIGKYPPAIFIIDGAKSHKKLLLSSITKNDNMAKMREYMRAHSEYAPCDTLWDEEAKGVGKGGKLSKEQLWAVCAAVKAKVPTMYRAAEIFRWSRFHPTAGFLPGHEVLFTPPYHPELQVRTNNRTNGQNRTDPPLCSPSSVFGARRKIPSPTSPWSMVA